MRAHTTIKSRGQEVTLYRLTYMCLKTVWPSGLRRWLQAPVRKGVGSNPTAVMLSAQCTHTRPANHAVNNAASPVCRPPL